MSTVAQTTMRIRCGTTASYTDSLGNLWQGDTGSNGGNIYSTTASIKGTSDQALYQAERYQPNGQSLVYTFTVPNGAYRVNLRFAEIYFTAIGKRTFNIKVQGVVAFTSLDIFATVGANAALTEGIDTTVTNGQIVIELDAVVENAKIDAIEILPTGPPPLVSLSISTRLLWCVKCDGTDSTPVVGSLLVSHNNTKLTFMIAADGSVNVNGTLDASVDPLVISFSLVDATGNPRPGIGYTLTMSSAFAKGLPMPLKLPGLLFTQSTDASGSPVILFKGLAL